MRNRKRKFLDNKKNAQNVHFKRRMIERYGIFFNRIEKLDIINQIQNSKAQFLYRESNTKSIWKIEIQGKSIPVVYDNLRKNLVTCLNWNMIKDNMKNFY